MKALFANRYLCLLLPALVLALLAPAGRAAAAPPIYRYENGHLLIGAFRSFYEANGDSTVFGLPLTDMFVEPSGLTVQYFEFARFEWHNRVELTHLGRFYAQRHPDATAFAWIAPGSPLADDRTYLPEAGHTLGGAFAWYWRQHGEVAVLGYPISEEFTDTQVDGSKRLVQYFERAILSYHPEETDTHNQVRRAPLGSRYAQEFVDPAHLAPSKPITVLASASLRFNPRSGDGHNIVLAASKLNEATIAPGGKLGFLQTLGSITAEAGYVAGSAIVNGEVVSNALGGGICTVSTLLYRAAWWAGLPVIDRTAHSFWLRAYADVPGLEAAVYDPGVELTIANDTADEIYVEALVVGDTVTVRLWGRDDGRTVTSSAPEVRAAGAATTASRTASVDAQQSGADVINQRTVRNADGSLLRSERVVTRYAPLPTPQPDGEAETDNAQPPETQPGTNGRPQ